MKKINAKGFSQIELLLVAVVVALVGGIGYYVWQSRTSQDQSKNADSDTQHVAQAEGYQVVLSAGGVEIKACRPSENPNAGYRVVATQLNKLKGHQAAYSWFNPTDNPSRNLRTGLYVWNFPANTLSVDFGKSQNVKSSRQLQASDNPKILFGVEWEKPITPTVGPRTIQYETRRPEKIMNIRDLRHC